jgi:hypothetical protein
VINPEILSNKPTHICPKNGPIKVFTDTIHNETATAEILTGKNKGKWTTVNVSKLKKT